MNGSAARLHISHRAAGGGSLKSWHFHEARRDL
jgi:hypothetical protein